MRLHHQFAILALAALLGGCASQTKLQRTVELSVDKIKLQDTRSPEQKARKHDALFSAILFHEDGKFSPRALDLFQVELLADATLSRPVLVEVNEFRIGDFYPVRLGAGGQGFLGPLLFETLIDKNTDWAFINEANIPKNADALVCVFVGRVNGKPVKAVASEPYKISPFAGLVANDPDYQRALDVVIKRAAQVALAQAGSAQK